MVFALKSNGAREKFGFKFEVNRIAHYTYLAALKNTKCADDHGDKGEVEHKQRDDKSKQVNRQVTDDEEENECVDVMRGDDCAQPLDTGP